MTTSTVPRGLARRGIDAVAPFSVGLTVRFRGVTRREGLLLHGAAGWGEWSPFAEYPPDVAAWWLAAAIEAATVAPPPPVRAWVPVNVTVPAVGPEEAAAAVASSGATTAKVKVAEAGGTLDEDLARVAAVRGALGPGGLVRVDANAAWDLAGAVTALPRLASAAGGLEYAEQPCRRLEDLAEVRRRTGIAIAVDESLRLAPDPWSIDLSEACDVLIVKVQPSGGGTRALRLAEAHGLPVVVSSALETSVGLAAGVRLAASLPVLEHACGLGTAALLAEDVVARPLVARGGSIAVAAADEAATGVDASDREARRATGSLDPTALLRRLDRALEVLDVRERDAAVRRWDGPGAALAVHRSEGGAR